MEREKKLLDFFLFKERFNSALMRRVFVSEKNVVTIEKMTPATATKPAKIKFAGMPEQQLKRKWGEG